MEYITSEQNSILREELIIIRIETQFKCGLCKELVKKTHRNIFGNETPYCPNCGVCFVPCWSLRRDGTYISELKAVTKEESDALPRDWNIIQKGNPTDLRTSETPTTQVEPNPDRETTPQPKNSGVAHPKASNWNQKKDVRGQILHIFNQKKGIVQTHELYKQIDAAERSIRTALNKLVNKGLVIKVKHGHYQLNKRSKY